MARRLPASRRVFRHRKRHRYPYYRGDNTHRRWGRRCPRPRPPRRTPVNTFRVSVKDRSQRHQLSIRRSPPRHPFDSVRRRARRYRLRDAVLTYRDRPMGSSDHLRVLLVCRVSARRPVAWFQPHQIVVVAGRSRGWVGGHTPTSRASPPSCGYSLRVASSFT